MDEPGKSLAEPRGTRGKWAAIILLLLVAIDGLLARLVEGLWDSLRESNNPAYLPMQWWMSAPFTLFVFAVLSALLTSFSGLRNWLKGFALLCGFKVIFAGVTTVFLYFRMDVSVGRAVLQAMFLSLPSVLVHIILSSVAAMFLMESFGPVAHRGEAAMAEPYFAGVEIEELLPRPETPAAMAPEELREGPATLCVMPAAQLVRLFPEDELALSPRRIEELSPSVEIPFEVILPQLSEGKVEVEALTVISGMPREAFRRPPEQVARRFPNGKIELPLREVVQRVSPRIFELPQQKMQPEVDREFPAPFVEVAPPAVEKPEERLAPSVEEAVEERAPAGFDAAGVPEEAFVLTDKERYLLEHSRDVIELSLESLMSQFPKGAVRGWKGAEGAITQEKTPQGGVGETPAFPETVVIPLELVGPQLVRGEVKLPAKLILAQFPEGCLSISEDDFISSLPKGEVGLPLPEIVPQLPCKLLAPPPQLRQPAVEDMPDPFREVEHPQPVVAEVAPAKEEPAVMARVSGWTQEPRPGGAQAAPAPVSPVVKEPGISYAELLREENPITLPVDALAAILPEGAFHFSAEELKRRLGTETVKLPKRMVVPQLSQGAVLVPVEILTMQLPPESFRMSVEQIKARFAEGAVELPLRELVWQVFTEIARRPERRRLQPQCEEISTIFHEIPQKKAAPEERPPVPAEAETAEKPPPLAGQAPVREVVATREEPRLWRGEEGATILGAIVQKCRGLGIEEHWSLAAGEYFVAVLAPSSMDGEALGRGMARIVAGMESFCGDYRLGELMKVVVSCSRGALSAIVCGEPARVEQRRLILIGSLNRSGAGLMSLIIDRLDVQLQALWSAQGVPPVEEPPARDVRRVSIKTDGMPEEVCRNIVAALSELGIDNCLSGETESGQKVVAAWGEASGLYESHTVDSEQPKEHPFSEGIFDTELLTRFCSDMGLETFESLLLVTQGTKVTLHQWRRGATENGEPACLLCFFPGTYEEGLVRAKAYRAARAAFGPPCGL